MSLETHKHRRVRLGVASLLAFLLLPSVSPAQSTDDTVLFSTVVPPNVILLMDNSGSMHHIVWHPMFNPANTPSCAYWTNTTQYFVDSSSGDSFPSGATDTTFQPGTHNIGAQPGCTSTGREIFVDPLVPANGDATRYMGRYLNWLYSPAADSYISEIRASNNGTLSACIGGGTYDLYRRSRVTAAQQILRQVICEVNAAGEVRFGLAQFRRGSDPNGGYVVVPANDYLDSTGSPNVYSLNGTTQSHGDHLNDAIDELTGEAWTPLGETLFQVYTYFMSRDAAERPSRGGKTFPEYIYEPDHANNGPDSGLGAPTVPDSPIEYSCQRNFVVIITDGEPTKDDFDLEGGGTDVGFDDFDTLIGDYNPGETEEPTTSPDCDGGTAWECGRYLDDIAKFMQETDFRPDMPAHNGNQQVIDVYTVGFTTNASANDLLQRTASVGNGTFSTSNDPAALAEDIVDAISDIIQKSQSFTAATVPATRTSEGGQFYTSLFVPSNEDGYWEGHLKSWQITSAGEILDSNDNCALNDPGAPATCVAGPFLPTAVPYWDAGELLDARTPASRNLVTTTLSSPGVSDLVSFDTTTLTAAHMNLTAADIPSYDVSPHPAPTTADELRDVVVDNLRGCELGTSGSGCPERSWKLGDIFHSDPVVVAGPSAFQSNADYQAFQSYYEHRKRVIVAGANDGFLRFFDAGTWRTTPLPEHYDAGTGQELVGFMPYAARQIAKDIPLDGGGRNVYGVDASPSVADVWFYSSPTVNPPKDGSGWQGWRTITVGGLRQGGNAYYALDITDPASATCPAPASGTQYPCYLWEFPREDATGGIVDYMGQTWSDPVIVKIKVNPSVNTPPTAATPGYDRWVAVFGTGYSPTSDPNDDSNYDVEATEGRAIVIVDLKTGRVLAQKKFDPTATTALTDPSTFVYSPTNPEQAMHYSFTASPGVYDLNFDGYADVIYMPDLGGNVWKWVIKNVGQDPINGSGSVSQPYWPFRKMFSAPTHYEAGPPAKTYYKSMFFTPSATLKSGKLWLVIGTGERMNLKFEGVAGTTLENNRLYNLVDRDPLDASLPTTVTLESNLTELPSYTTCADLSGYDGYYFVGEEAEKFVTNSDIFSFIVLTASYVPTISTDPCISSGTAKLYAYSIYCGAGVFVEPGSGGVPSISVDLGSGMPTSPQITISSGGYTGSSTDPNPNKVIINNQDGEVVVPGSGDLDGDGSPDCPGPDCPCPNWPNDCPLPEGGGGIGQFYWREL